jgi:two-component system response regulator FixJ
MLRSRGFDSQIYSSGAEFLSEARVGDDCVLLDIRMPHMDGFSVLAELRKQNPAIPVIMMTGHGDVPTAVKALRLGATDFVEKPFSEDEIIGSIERTLEISSERDARESRKMRALERLQPLTPRETEVLRGLMAGLSNKDIARRLGISHRTVEMHRANMMRDLECTSLSEVVRIAIEANISPLETNP